ncbi:TRAP transporter large permease [Gemmobacter sp.]|uniref:TRAP transporter large permease n=1 Tax=Gemmobacter sp. TaxID=1898957 RepID=UPI002AFEA9D6|nr:TRAP transporter large permease [Gemmobacter sp.]
MDLVTSLVGLAAFLGLLVAGLWIPFAIACAGIVMILSISGISGLNALSFVIWSSMNAASLSAIPLFMLMAALLLRSGVSRAFYDALSVLVRRVPGGLLQTNIIGCAMFAAISGSSVATAAAIGTVAIPQLREKGYDNAMTAGSLAAGGTLGILIPPSIAMIIYGTFAEVSIAKLFMAGVVPGIVLTLIFMGYIAVRVWLTPALAPREPAGDAGARRLAGLLPIAVLMLMVLGSIYTGKATPTEAAALGVVGALAICAVSGGLSVAILADCLQDTLKTSAAILFITMAAFVFAYGMEKGGVGRALTDWVGGLGLSQGEFILALVIGYLLLGCVVDSIGMIVLTIPILVPTLHAMQIDLIWFGIMLVVAVEIGQITPPLGLNLFVIESIARRGIVEVIRGATPYIGLFILFLALLWLVPQLATWLPGHVM